MLLVVLEVCEGTPLLVLLNDVASIDRTTVVVEHACNHIHAGSKHLGLVVRVDESVHSIVTVFLTQIAAVLRPEIVCTTGCFVDVLADVVDCHEAAPANNFRVRVDDHLVGGLEGNIPNVGTSILTAGESITSSASGFSSFKRRHDGQRWECPANAMDSTMLFFALGQDYEPTRRSARL